MTENRAEEFMDKVVNFYKAHPELEPYARVEKAPAQEDFQKYAVQISKYMKTADAKNHNFDQDIQKIAEFKTLNDKYQKSLKKGINSRIEGIFSTLNKYNKDFEKEFDGMATKIANINATSKKAKETTAGLILLMQPYGKTIKKTLNFAATLSYGDNLGKIADWLENKIKGVENAQAPQNTQASQNREPMPFGQFENEQGGQRTQKLSNKEENGRKNQNQKGKS